MKTLPMFKRGDTFVINAVYRRDGAGIDLTEYTITSEIRTPDVKTLISKLVPTIGDQKKTPGAFTLKPEITETREWMLGNQVMDVTFSLKGVKITTETITLPIVEHVTEGA